MNPLIILWFLFASITARGSYYDIKADNAKHVQLFKQTAHGYTTYDVTTN